MSPAYGRRLLPVGPVQYVAARAPFKRQVMPAGDDLAHAHPRAWGSSQARRRQRGEHPSVGVPDGLATWLGWPKQARRARARSMCAQRTPVGPMVAECSPPPPVLRRTPGDRGASPRSRRKTIDPPESAPQHCDRDGRGGQRCPPGQLIVPETVQPSARLCPMKSPGRPAPFRCLWSLEQRPA